MRGSINSAPRRWRSAPPNAKPTCIRSVLLTGATPYDVKSLRKAGFDEIRRIIREVDPPRPSTRLSLNADTLASVAAQRHIEPRKLVTILRGDLDWIIMKAMEKDRARRYE